MLMLLLVAALADVPPVPGLCSAPVPADRDTPGCYQTNTLPIVGTPATLHWQVREYPSLAAADAEARRHKMAATTAIHGRNWLHVLGPATEAVAGGTPRASIGPLAVPPGAVTAHFAEAIFPPGMRTRVHSHRGPEAFYVVDGEQCMDSPAEHRMIPAGGTYIVPGGPHLQAAPRGRRNLVLILSPTGQPVVIPGGDWKPSTFCD